MPGWLEIWLIIGLITGILNSLYLGTRYKVLDVDGRHPIILLFLLVSVVAWPIICFVTVYNLFIQLSENSKSKVKSTERNKIHLEYRNSVLDKMEDNNDVSQALAYFDRNKSIKNLLVVIMIIKEQKAFDDFEVSAMINELKSHLEGMGETGLWYIRIPKKKEESELQKSIRISSPRIKYQHAKELCEAIILHEGRKANYKIIEAFSKTEAQFS